MRTNLRVRVFEVLFHTTRGGAGILWGIIFVLCMFTAVSVAHADSGDDFFIQRGTTTISGTSTTLAAGVDYIAPSASTSAFLRIVNSHYTGAGPNTGAGTSNADDVTAYIVDPWNVATSVTIARGASAGGNTRVAWEIVEYQGVAGGENEIIVRQQQFATYNVASTSVSGPSVPNVTSDSDIVVFITGQFNPDTGVDDYNTVLSTSNWSSTTDTAVFTRGETGNDAVIVSYAVVEFTGSNWGVQRTVDHTYSNAGSTETESITAVGSLARAFIHAQHRAGSGSNTHADFGHEVWLSGIGQVSFRLDSGAGTSSGHVSAAWVIENTQTEGKAMVVTRSNGTQSGGTSPTTTAVSIGKTLDDLTISSLFMNNSGSGSGRSWPEPMISTRISSSTEYEIWISDSGDSRDYRTEIVEWPTAVRDITQNYYYFFVNNNALTPVDPWPTGGGDIGENSEITGLDDPLGTGDTIRIRMTLNISGASMPSAIDAFKLQYAERTSTCSAISSWQNLGGIGSTTAIWRGTTTPVADGTTLGALLISVSDVAGTFEEENDTALSPNLVQAGEDIEYDWAIEDNGAPGKTDYCFRMIEDDDTVFIGYDFYPVVRTVGYGAESQEWRWYGDAENETPTTPMAASNTAPIDVAFEDEMQLRIVLREVNGADGSNVKFRLQFSEYPNFSTSTFVAETGDCVDGTSLWCYADGGGMDNATITTALLTESDSCASSSGPGCGTHNESGTSSSTSDHVHQTGDASEFAFAVRHSGARVNRVYYFRAYDETNGEAVPLGAGEAYPSLVTEGAQMSFAMGGIASSTVIEGVTTDIDTTPTEINFGTVAIDSELEAAHSLTVDTNGTEGYQVLIMTRNDFLNTYGTQIKSITSSNATPAGWSAACIASADGCFGYHSGDPTLEGGSGRFAAVDTYAKFSSTTPEEIAYSSVPIASDTVNIIYKLQVRELQEAGQYETNIIYIAIPVF